VRSMEIVMTHYSDGAALEPLVPWRLDSVLVVDAAGVERGSVFAVVPLAAWGLECPFMAELN
jgi:hypothetical protein